MIDLILENQGQRKFLELPASEEKLRQMRERLSVTPEESVDIEYIHCRYGTMAFNRVLHENHILCSACTPDEIPELNLLAYILKRMDQHQFDTFNREICSGRTRQLINLAFRCVLPVTQQPGIHPSEAILYDGGNLQALLVRERSGAGR